MAELLDESASGYVSIKVKTGRSGAVEDRRELRDALVLLLGTVVCNFGKDALHAVWNEAMKEAEW